MTFENGTYRWTCEADEEYKRTGYRFAIKVCTGVSLGILLITVLFTRDTETMIYMILTCALMMLIGVGVGRYALYGKKRLEIPFEMTDRYLHAGTGKGSSYVGFRTVRRVEADGKKIRLHTLLTKTTVLVPPEDYEQIRDFVLDRVEKERGAAASR